MTDTNVARFLELAAGRRGHFRMESGLHARLWLDLDALFAAPRRISPFVDLLSDALRPHRVQVVCGPLLGGAFLAQLVARDLAAEFCFAERAPAEEGGGLFSARYRLAPAFQSRVRGKRVAIVDDVMSAGSSLRATYLELQGHGAIPVVAGALLVFGTVGADHFAQLGIPVEAPLREQFQTWRPEECLLCAAGEAIEDVAAS